MSNGASDTRIEAQPIVGVGWSIQALHEHYRELRIADLKLADDREKHQREIQEANDRRYSEVADQRDTALTIGKTADDKALNLAQELRTLLDSKAEQARDKNLGERGTFATQADLADVLREIKGIISPITATLATLVAAESQHTGSAAGVQMTIGRLFGSIAALGGVIGIVTWALGALVRT